MRFPADESCDFTVVTALRNAGHDITAIAEINPGVEDDVVRGFFAGEDGRQHDAVVVDVGFIAEDRHVELAGVLQDLLETGHSGHAIADDNEALHRETPAGRPEGRPLPLLLGVGSWALEVERSTLTADCL